MAAAESSVTQAELAIGRLVVETSIRKELIDVESLGPSCLAMFESVGFLHSSVGTPKANCFLVTSKRVLPKGQLMAIENPPKKKKKFSVKIIVEFLGTETDRSLQRKPLSDLYSSLEKDVFELNGVTYVAVTNEKGSSLLSRGLEVFNFSEGSKSSVLLDELQCLDFGGEGPQKEENVSFSIRAYDLLQRDFANDDSRLRKRFLKEDDFQKGDKPLGPIIVNKDCQLAGFLYFYKKEPYPLLFGSKFTETGETMTHSEIGKKCFSGGVYPLLESYLQVDNEGGNGKDQFQEENDEGPSPTENSCRSINSDKTIMRYVPDPKSDETMQQGDIDTEMPVGASGGVYPLMDPDLPSKSKEVVGKINTEMPEGASSSVYPLLGPDLPSKSQVVVGNIDKRNPDMTRATPQMAVTKCAPVAEAEINVTDANNGSNSDLTDFDLQQLPVNGGGSNKELQEEKDLEQVTECAVDGGRQTDSQTLTEPSPISFKAKVVKLPPKNDSQTLTEPSPISFQAEVVKLPPENDKDITVSRVVSPDHDREHVNSQPSSVTIDAVCEGASNITPQGRPTQEHSRVKKSTRCPYDLTKKDKYAQLKRTTSDLQTRVLEEKRKFGLSDLLAKTIPNCLELLEGLCRCLDKEYRYGACKCWKHIAENFGIKEKEYQNFKCSQIQSPTEVMFEYLQTSNPDLAIGEMKCALHSIGRQDVVGVLVKHDETYRTLNDETLVCSLFDSHPDIIGEMAFLLDMQKKGLKNWSHLAAKLNIPRNDFKSFETCNAENPTQELFQLLKIKFHRSTIKELIDHLWSIKRHDVIKAIKESTKVTEGSLIKDLMADLDVMDNVCDLLNQKQRTNKVKGWKHLGTKFGVEKEALDDLSPIEEDLVCPTEALIANLGASNPWLTIADFIWAIHKIDRNDALDVLNVYLPDGCIPELLKSCDCERCQKSRLLEKTGETDEL